MPVVTLPDGSKHNFDAPDTVFDVAWSPDAKSIVTASHDASWRVWSV